MKNTASDVEVCQTLLTISIVLFVQKISLNDSKFVRVDQFRADFQKINNLRKSELSSQFWSSIISISQILQKLKLPQIFFQKNQSSI